MRSRRRRILMAGLVVASGFLVIGAIRAATAFDETSCRRDYGIPANSPNLPNGWDDSNYHYMVRSFSLNANVYADPGSQIDSRKCRFGYRTFANGTDIDLVYIDDLTWTNPAGVAVRPVGLELGVPAVAGAPPAGNNNGVWDQLFPPGGNIPTHRPPVYRNNFGREAANFDDAGKAVIGGVLGNQTIWCQSFISLTLYGEKSMNGAGQGEDNRKCAPDIFAKGIVDNDSNGAGYLFTETNCPTGAADIGGGLLPVAYVDCTNSPPNSPSFSWYQRYDHPKTDYTDTVGTDPITGSLLNFYLHMQVEQTQHGGFGDIMYMTFKYPKSYDMKAFIKEGPGMPVPGVGTLSPGSNYTIQPGLKNAGLVPSNNPTYMQVENSYPAYVRPDPPPPCTPAGNCTGMSKGSAFSDDYGSLCKVPRMANCNNQHWSWEYTPIAPGAGDGIPPTLGGPSFSFKVAGNTPDGTNLCFETYVAKQNVSGGEARSGAICWRVVNPSFPSLDTTGGDVHAGGGVGVGCGSTLAAGQGTIQGNVQASGVGAQYIASAYGSINNFAKPGGALFGDGASGGYYGPICRPNLAAVADKYPSGLINDLTTSIGINGTITSGTVLADGKVNVATGNTIINARPALTGRTTLYVKGDLTINGSLTYLGGSLPLTLQPSFGVIVTGSIYVRPAATRLDGFYSAGNTTISGSSVFDSCFGGTTTTCRPALTVNGFIMANSLSLGRTTIGNPPGAYVSEQVNLNGLLYLRTPPAFEGQTDAANNLPIFIGDRPPVY